MALNGNIMNKLEKQQEDQELLHHAMKHRYGKNYNMMFTVFEKLFAGENVYLSTHNKEWFKVRFNDLKGPYRITFHETNSPLIFKLELNEKNA